MEIYQFGVEVGNPKHSEEVIHAFRSAMLEVAYGEEIRSERFPGVVFLSAVFEMEEGSEDDIEEFVESISAVIWKANGEYCPIEMKFVTLSSVPHRIAEMDEEAYEKVMGKGN